MRYLLMGFFACITISASAQQPAFIKEIDGYINEGIKEWQVPALAIVVIKDGEVVIRKGYGVLKNGTKTAVDEHTLFYIASNTKLFTGTALSNLAYQKKLSLDDKVTKYFPDFRLYNDWVTKEVSIRDMLTHRIGTKTFQGDFTFWNSSLTSWDIMQKMRLMQPSQVFRQDYGYCNSCYLVAGETIGAATGISWGKYVNDSLLKKAGMHESYALSNEVHKTAENMATPYTTSYSGKLEQVPFDQWDNLGPAASIVSNVHDLTNWLMLQLDSGKLNNKQVLPWPVLRQTRQMQIATNSNKSPVFPMHFRGYGLGLNMADYNGRQIFWHTGGAAGMVSNVCFVPEEQLGIAILTTNDNQNFFEALRYQVLDAYLDVPFINRSKQFLPSHKEEMQAQLDEINGWKKRLKNNLPQLAAESYEGTYQNELYGRIQVVASGKNKLTAKLPLHNNMQVNFTYLDGDDWLVEYSNIEYGIFTMQFKIENQKVISFNLPANPFVEMDAYLFTKSN